MEAVLKREINDIGYDVTRTIDGRVYFKGDDETIVRANLCLRTAQRVMINVAQFKARTYDELFENVKAAKLMAILKLAQSLSRTYKEQVKDYKFKVEAEKLVISTAFSDDMIFEILAFEANKAYFEEICGIQAILKRKRIY